MAISWIARICTHGNIKNAKLHIGEIWELSFLLNFVALILIINTHVNQTESLFLWKFHHFIYHYLTFLFSCFVAHIMECAVFGIPD
jgi:hypothetical protein